MSLQQLNSLSDEELGNELKKCCGSQRWLTAMLAARPYSSEDAIYTLSDTIWSTLSEPDYLEAFAQHPMIGDIGSLQKKFSASADWASDEQQGTNHAPMKVLTALSKGNHDYLQKFGFIFIVCASGKSAIEMLDLIEQRLRNERATELKLAASEQNKITILRLKKLLVSN